MKKNLKTIVVLSFVAFAIFTFATRTNANLYAAESAVDVNPDNARTLFINNCARCHGADGSGQTELGRKYDVPDLTEVGKKLSSAKAIRVITNGKSDMPAFGKKLTKKQISSLASYVRTL